MGFNYKNRTYPYRLTSDTEDLLEKIDNFLGFAPFVPKDEHSKLTVYLDDNETRKTKVTIEELKRELAELEEELGALEKHKNKNNAKEESSPEERRLRDRIERIKDIIKRCKEERKDYIELYTNPLGYYTRCGESKGREIVLLMGTIGSDPYLTAIVYVHELMHAYFDNHVTEKTHCPEAEEPLAEYGMLCFMEMFVRTYPEYRVKLFERAKYDVERKKNGLVVCHYGYGHYLFEDKNNTCVDWLTLYHNACVTPAMTTPEMNEYKEMISPVMYPHSEKACEMRLEKALRLSQTVFKAGPCICRGGTDMYFTISKESLAYGYFNSLYPPKTKITLTFEDKSGKTTGVASVVCQSRIHILKDLFDDYIRHFGSGPRNFVFMETSVANKEWLAKEI